MGETFEQVVTILASKAVFLAITSALVGGTLTFLKNLVISENDVQNRVEAYKQVLTERIMTGYRSILTSALSLATPAPEIDPFHTHARELIRVIGVLGTLDGLVARTRNSYTRLFATTILGVLGTILFGTPDGIRAAVAVVCGVALIIQLFAFKELREIASRLSEYERHT